MDALLEAAKWGRLLVTLGAEVVKAIRAGESTKTVGEIFDGAVSDMSEIDRLEAERFASSEGG